MSRGDELRRLLQIMQRLRDWVSPSDLEHDLITTRRTVNRILRGIQEEMGLDRRKTGRRVEYRLRKAKKGSGTL